MQFDQMMPGIFITFEGGDCTGKSTQLRMLAKRLRDEYPEILETKEPGGSSFGKPLREILLDPLYLLDPISEVLLFYAERPTHIKEKILPALRRGAIVLGDRFYDSTLTYQIYGRGVNAGMVHAIHEVAVGSFKPNVTLLYDAPADVLQQRVAMRKGIDATVLAESKFDDEDVQFYTRVRKGYLELARQEPDRFRIFDATLSIEDLHEETYRVVKECIDKKSKK